MNSMINYLFLCFFVISATACNGSGWSRGDGSSNGNQVSQARINAGNAEQLGTAATEAAKQTVQNQTATGLGFRSSGKPNIDTISSDLSKSFSGRIANAPAPFICLTGSLVEVTNPDGSTTVTFTMCEIVLGLAFLDGIVNASSSVSGNTTTVDLEYIGFTISIGPDVITIDMQTSCTTDNTTMETSCIFYDIVGFDGRIYTFSDATVSGDGITGYIVSATIVDPDHGSFSIVTTSPILFLCANGQPISGGIQFTDGADVLVSVTFNDCASYTVSYSGTAEVFLW
jgi:hypothetical protein